MHQLTVQPTWKTAVVRKKLKGRTNDFQVELMDGMFKECCFTFQSKYVSCVTNNYEVAVLFL